jgi:hypothetical protein
MVPNGKPTRNSDYRHAQSVGRQRQAAQRAAADEIPDHLADVLPQDESPMLPDTEPVTASAAAPDPALQRAVVSACEYVQRMYDGAVDAAPQRRHIVQGGERGLPLFGFHAPPGHLPTRLGGQY